MMDASAVHTVLREHMLVDGYPFVLDLEKSHGSWLHDALSGEEYLDLFTCFASWPLGYNHPKLIDPEFREVLTRAALTKVANSDIYTREMAAFVQTFATHTTPPGFPNHFWVSGGALAVENALKVAFDWRARKLGRTHFAENCDDLVVLHFHQAFHGRSGYTMSLTNTVPDKIGLYPKFAWPRVHNPALEFDLDGGIANDAAASERRACDEIEAAFREYPGKIAAILIEPMQGEGGDNHFRTEFLKKLRDYADTEDALLLFDEVQTGFYGSGKPWLWQHHGVAPDVVAFGKKSQVCGIYASTRIDEVPDNVFALSSRINSTWGGNLTDMVRSQRFIEIIEEERLADNVLSQGQRMLDGLRALARERGAFRNVRGIGSLVAFTLPDPASRDGLLAALGDRRVLALPCGPDSIRFRLPLNISADEVDVGLERLAACLPAKIRA